MVSHMEQILNAVPEVESTSRRTGLELGLAAVTEANRGDILVKLKENRDRDIDDVMEDVRKTSDRPGTGRDTSSSSKCCRT